MPHLIIEYSAPLEKEVIQTELLFKAREIVVNSGVFAPGDVKARLLSYEHFALEGDAKNFIHMTLHLLEGRDVAIRQKLADGLFSVARTLLPQVDKVSINLNEMEKATYRKT